jgi:hypothetical protein
MMRCTKRKIIEIILIRTVSPVLKAGTIKITGARMGARLRYMGKLAFDVPPA